jgi:hypothetical protein
MPEECEILVYVRSRPALAEVRQVHLTMSVAASATNVMKVPLRRSLARFEPRLDDEQKSVVREAMRVGRETGNPVHVVDLARVGPLARFVRMRLLGANELPIVLLKGACPWYRLGGPALPLARRVAH